MAEAAGEDERPSTPIVPHDFEVPMELVTPRFRLEPLGVQHNRSDHHAWMSSIDHIGRTPGFVGRRWPSPMSLERNAADLQEHADHFAARAGFTYTVLDPETDEVIGCVYLYEDDEGGAEVHARSWVRADRAELDVELWRAVTAWLEEAWPFETVRYAPREG